MTNMFIIYEILLLGGITNHKCIFGDKMLWSKTAYFSPKPVFTGRIGKICFFDTEIYLKTLTIYIPFYAGWAFTRIMHLLGSCTGPRDLFTSVNSWYNR